MARSSVMMPPGPSLSRIGLIRLKSGHSNWKIGQEVPDVQASYGALSSFSLIFDPGVVLCALSETPTWKHQFDLVYFRFGRDTAAPSDREACGAEILVSLLSSFVFGVDVDRFVQIFQSEEDTKLVGVPTNIVSPKHREYILGQSSEHAGFAGICTIVE